MWASSGNGEGEAAGHMCMLQTVKEGEVMEDPNEVDLLFIQAVREAVDELEKHILKPQ